MRIDVADTIKIGDIVYNCFMDELVVTSIYGKGSSKIVFSTIDTRLHRSSYNFSDLYLKGLEDESDDEKSWVSWAKNNRDFFDEFFPIDFGVAASENSLYEPFFVKKLIW